MQDKDKITIGQQITQCLDELRSTDYKAIKYAEGELSESEYAPIREARRVCRLRINELEEKLKNEVPQ